MGRAALLRALTGTVSRRGERSVSVLSDAFGPPPARQHRQVVVTGLGLVTPLGIGVQAVWQRLLAGESGTRALVPEDLPEGHQLAFGGLPCRVAGLVPAAEYQAASERHLRGHEGIRNARFMNLALLAASEALQGAGWSPTEASDRDATGVAIGSGMSFTADLAEAGALMAKGRLRRLGPMFVPKVLGNMAAGAVSIRWGLRGPNLAPATACAAGTHAVGDAFRLVRDGTADVMVAGGSEACVDAVSLAAFGRMRALVTRYNDQPEQASRPFDTERAGFVMGEGAGVLVLESAEHAALRGAEVLAEVRGYGMSGDGLHITQPHPEGDGAVRAMTAAVRDGGLSASDICHVNAHATSTPLGDLAEATAIRQFVGSEGPQPWVTSTKGATGHLLGAAGAVEAVFSVLSIMHKLAPPTANLQQPDPALAGMCLVQGQPASLEGHRLCVMSNSFGFGGTNASLVFGPPPAERPAPAGWISRRPAGLSSA